MEKKRILITGIPGTGKSAIGDYFQREYGYKHVDCEDLPGGNEELKVLIERPDEFIRSLLIEKRNVVVTWGFPPEHGEGAVIKFKESGFKLFWLDGDRSVALRVFIERGGIEEIAFYMQMYRIINFDIIRKIQPVIINPFDKEGKFKPMDRISKEITSYL